MLASNPDNHQGTSRSFMKKRFAVDGVSYDNPNRILCEDIAQVRGLEFDLAKILRSSDKK